MPKELIATAPRTPVFREYDEPELGDGQVRIRTEFASPKHGTELVGYRDEPAANRPYQAALGAVVPITDEGRSRRFPMRLGNMAVGVVTEVGSGTTKFAVGDRVFGHLPIRETHTVDPTQVDLLPEGLSAEAAVCLDPVVMALAMRDAEIRLGDHVAVFGVGAIGLFAVQLARASGADYVIAVDPIAHRREIALALGADVALDPIAEGDVGAAIRRMTGWRGAANTPLSPERTRVRGGYWEEVSQTGQLGVDVAVEVSGSSRALHDAVRCTRFGGAICVLSFYGRDAAGLHLGEEFHVNRLKLVSARAQSLPLRDAPAWNLARLVDVSLAWLGSGRLRTKGIVWPIVPFAESAEAYRAIDERPHESIKLGITFP
jgi:threonine dehydrogenase-like Zn-dependent dehydrogenase